MKIEELIQFGNGQGYQIPINLKEAETFRQEIKMNLSIKNSKDDEKERIRLATQYDFYNELVIKFGGNSTPLEELNFYEN
jgi:hypothetical protein